ncbi:TPA: hypothetical protein ACHIW2_003761 [Escherichia coli]|nr:hypothetical protein [Escherichia coli]
MIIKTLKMSARKLN